MRASKALQLFPSALLAVALLTIAMLSYSQDRYSFGAYWYMSGQAYYNCANYYVNWGNGRAASIRRDRAAELLVAWNNMETIDNFDNPPIPPAPSRGRLSQVIGWIAYAVELTVYNIGQFRNYNSDQIIAGINSHYDGQLYDLDDDMATRTGRCAEAQIRKNNFDEQRRGQPTTIWYTAYTGFNQWLGYPARRPD